MQDLVAFSKTGDEERVGPDELFQLILRICFSNPQPTNRSLAKFMPQLAADWYQLLVQFQPLDVCL